MARKRAPEITFQQHIAAYLVREHQYGVLEQTDITDYRKSLIHECVTGQRRITEADSAGSPQADVTAAQRVEPSLSKLRQI